MPSDLWLQRGEQPEAQGRIPGARDGQVDGRGEQVPAVLCLQHGEEDKAEAFASEGERGSDSIAADAAVERPPILQEMEVRHTELEHVVFDRLANKLRLATGLVHDPRVNDQIHFERCSIK